MMNEKILILDDEETLCYFLKESLEEKGYQAVTAHTAREGLKVATEQHVDLVLLDLKLPDGDGLSVLYEIRKADSDLPVIVLTGHAAVESAVQAMKLGAYDYLEKPINLSKLSSSVAQALESRPGRSPAAGVSEADVAEGLGDRVETGREQMGATGTGAWAEYAESARMHRQLERQVEELLALDLVSSEMTKSLKLHDLVEAAAEGLVRWPSVDMAAVFLGEPDGEEFVLAAQRRFPAPLWEDKTLRRVPVEGIVKRFATHLDEALSLGEVGPDPWIERLKAVLGNNIAGLLVPLRHNDQLRGLMLVGRRGRRAFDSHQIKMLCLIAQRLTLAVGHAALLDSLGKEIRQLWDSRALLESIVNNIVSGLIVVDSGGSVRLLNRAGEKMLGRKEDEVIGSTVEECLGSGAEIVRDSLDRAQAFSGDEILVERSGGESVPLAMSVSPLRDDAGKLNGVVVMLSDLREAKALEEERRSLDRQAFLSDISAVMAHEIRNPLAGIGAGIQHLLTKFEEGDERRGAMERVLKESERVNGIIEDILLISRPPHLSIAPCDITEVIEGVLSRWAEKASEKGVEIRKYCATGLPPVSGDRMRLQQALSNLVLNGIEAMPDGGELSVAVTGPGSSNATGNGAWPALEGEGSYVEIEIRDTGDGIGQGEIGRVFEPFDRAKARGTGLGLAIAGRIIDEHGGDIEVESGAGAGTRFVARLPVARREDS